MIGGSFEILDEELTFATGNPTTLMETSFPAFPLADPTGFLAVTSVAYRGGIVSCLVEERDCWFLSPGAPEWHHLPSPSSSDHKNSPLVKAPGDKICFLGTFGSSPPKKFTFHTFTLIERFA